LGNAYCANLVSVVITAYNYADFLTAVLDSIYGQRYRPLEIILIDDHSTDTTAKLAEQWRRQKQEKHGFHHFFYLRLPKNCGYAGAASIGFYLAAGEFIAMQDADDLSHPEKIEKQVAFLRNYPEYSIVGTNYCAFDSDNPRIKKYPTFIKYGEEIRKSYSMGNHCVSVGTILFRREILEKIGGLSTRVEGAEDYEFIARAIGAGFLVANLPEVLYYYRSHPRQRSRRFYG
jgi:glycosyltransferase involved in cell wall biosynthesis